MMTGLPSRGPNSARHMSMSLTWTGPDTVAGGNSGIGGSTFHGCSANAPKALTAKVIPTSAAIRNEVRWNILLSSDMAEGKSMMTDSGDDHPDRCACPGRWSGMTAMGRDLPVTEHLSSVAMKVSDGGRAAVPAKTFALCLQQLAS